MSATDPFAAPGSSMVIDTKATQSDLPAQARIARDRPMPRGSVRRNMFAALIIPVVFIALASLLFQIYSLVITLNDALEVRAKTVVSAIKSSLATDLSLLPREGEINPGPVGTLAQKGSDILDSTPDAVIFAAQSGTLGSPAVVSRLSIINNDELFDAFKDYRATYENPIGTSKVTINGEEYLIAYGRLQYRADLTPVGDVYIGFRQTQIVQQAIRQTLTPLVALVVVLIFVAFLVNALAARVTRPIVAATEQANRIALGDLDRSVNIESNDEIGDMLGSLERMRVSLKSMVARLRKNT